MNYKKEAERFMSFMPRLKSGPHENVQRLSKGEFFTLLNLKDQAMTGSELAKKAQISTARMTAIINGLEKKGYVRRLADGNDRRRIQLEITAEGQQQVKEIYNESVKCTEQYLKFLGEEDTAHLIRIMERSAEYFECKK